MMRTETFAARDALRNAIARLDHYGAPRDDSRCYVDEDNCLTELLATSPEINDGDTDSPLTLGHLRDILTHLISGE